MCLCTTYMYQYVHKYTLTLLPFCWWALSAICRYRAPECLLTDGHYNHKMDMWSVGCVLFEVMWSVFPTLLRYMYEGLILTIMHLSVP